jgi:uncharacterized membrane protein YgcG
VNLFLRIASALLCIFFCLASSSAAQDFSIEKFHSDITISEDSSVAIEEQISVRFHRPKHGIYREIPFRYSDDSGGTIMTPLNVHTVTDRSGRELTYKVKRAGNIIHIRIGDADRYVQGVQEYIITYTVQNALLFFDDHDELYWNVTGNYWKAPVLYASANVSLRNDSSSNNLWTACYTGITGSRETACSIDISPNGGMFGTTRKLSTAEGLTIAFGWDKGLVTPPSAFRKLLWTMDLAQNWVFGLPLLSLCVMTYLWHIKGKDPRVRESVHVRYEPPVHGGNHLPPAEVGTLVDEKFDPRDITSTIVGLAVKGYIRIEEAKTEGIIFDTSDHYIAKIKEPDAELSPFESLLMQRIFSGGTSGRMVSEMKGSFYTELDILKKTLYGELVKRKFFLVSPDHVRNLYTIAGIIVLAASVCIGGFLLPGNPFPKSIIAGMLTALPVFLFGRGMPAKTRSGASSYMDILGFEEFLNRAEKDRLVRIGDKDLFSRFLPYAIALDVVDNWAKAFEGISQEAPRWYVSQGGIRTFSPSGFSRSINAATSSLASAMFSAPRGSGISGGGGFSGGGGSSGGGFGGGGGGSW